MLGTRTWVAVLSSLAVLASGWADGRVLGAEQRPEGRAPRLMPTATQRELRELLPKVDDPQIQAVLDDPRLMLYTEDEMPRAHQDWDGALPGVHSAYYNISADGSEPFGNGNREFPWGTAGGTHRSPNVSAVRFLWLPRDENGKVLPVTWYRTHLRGDASMGYAWTFPVGAILGEVLLMNKPGGGRVPFELRVRIRESSEWDVNAFRPFTRAEYLAKRIAELKPQWRENPDLKRLMEHLEQPIKLTVARLTSQHPVKTVFDQRMGIDTLPPINDPQLVTRLVTETTFRSAAGEDWRQGSNGIRTCAPTTTASYHIVPANYDAGFIDVDRVSCMRCHDSANQHVRDFEPFRDWYGRIRGSDGIFSFHPWEPSSISWNGYPSHPSMRQELIDAGWLAPFDPSKHPPTYYTKIRGLDE